MRSAIQFQRGRISFVIDAGYATTSVPAGGLAVVQALLPAVKCGVMTRNVPCCLPTRCRACS